MKTSDAPTWLDLSEHRLTQTTSRERYIDAGSSAPPELLRRVEAEYREMPGLTLTVAQTRRLFGLDSATCVTVLACLTERQILRRTAFGTYRRGPQLEPITARRAAWMERWSY